MEVLIYMLVSLAVTRFPAECRCGTGIASVIFSDLVGPYFIFMDDNARPHRDYLLDDYLEREYIQRMDRPVMSPDMNPIEDAWDALER